MAKCLKCGSSESSRTLDGVYGLRDHCLNCGNVTKVKIPKKKAK